MVDWICADPLIVLGPPEPLACAEEEPIRNKCGEIGAMEKISLEFESVILNSD